MNDFIVPQDLNIKDRIGAFTLGQWGFLAAGFLLSSFSFMSENVPFIIAILFAIPIMGTSLILALFKKYDMPIYEFIMVYLIFKTQPKEMIYSSENKMEFDFEDDEELGDFILG